MTEAEAVQLEHGVNLFVRMIGLDQQRLSTTADEQDLIASLQSIKDSAELSRRMLGKQKYQGVNFQPCRAIKDDMETYLLNGETPQDTMTLRRRNLAMFTLVVEPTIGVLSKYSHDEVLSNTDSVIQQITQMVYNCSAGSTYEDGIAARDEYRAMVAERTRIRDAAKRPKKKRTTTKDIVELLQEIAESGELDD